MILCPHGCGTRLHPPIDDGGATLREHDLHCALVPSPVKVTNRPAKLGFNTDAKPGARAGATPKLFATRSAEARDWAAFAAAAMTGLLAADFHRDETLDYARRAAELADDLFAEYRWRVIEQPAPAATPALAPAAGKTPSRIR